MMSNKRRRKKIKTLASQMKKSLKRTVLGTV